MSAEKKRVMVTGAVEEGLRQMMTAEARKQCAAEQLAFVECTKQGKWIAVTKCREQLRILNECLKPQYVACHYARVMKE
jgi:hypothetical protein